MAEPSISQEALTFYPTNGLFKIVYQTLILPNLPEPFHYLNFISLIGQPASPICYNASAITMIELMLRPFWS